MRKSFRYVAAAMCAFTFVGCSKPEPPTEQLSPEDLPPLKYKHHYVSVDNGVYLYSQALTDAQRAAGQVAPGYIGFRYIGTSNGVYQVVTEDWQQSATCTDPCQIVKIQSAAGVDRIQFDNRTIAGAALDDAMHGELKPFKTIVLPSPVKLETDSAKPSEQTPTEDDAASQEAEAN